MKTLLRSLVSIALLATASPLWSADVSINSLPAIGSVSSSTVLPVVDVSGTPTTKKATVTQLINGLPVATGSTVGTMSAADKAKLDAATDANTASAIVRRDASGNFTAGTVTAGTVTGLANPTNGSDAANKSYVDASAAGLTVKQAARAATTANVTLAGGAPVTLDGLTLVASDRILVKNQATNTENGIYYVSTLGSGSNGTWTRTTDADTGAELDTGTYIFISSGTANANAAYTMVTQGPITLGTSPIVWALFSQVTSIAASSITGQLIESQIQDAAINTAKFAAGLTPVEIFGVLPTTGNFAGRQVFLTTDSKLYRYNGSAFTTLVPTVDLQGTITTLQIANNAITAGLIEANAVTSTKIADNAISSPKIVAGAITTAKILAGAVTADTISANAITAGKIAANAVTAGTVAANAITAGTIAVNAVTAGTIVAGAVNTTELAAGAVNAGKIAAGAVTADKITVANFTAVAGNILDLTAGTIRANTSITLGTGVSAVSITNSGQTVGGGRISFLADGLNPRIMVTGNGAYSTSGFQINGANDPVPPFFSAFNASGSVMNITTTGGIGLFQSTPIRFGTGSRMEKITSDGWSPPVFDGDNTIEFQWSGGLKVRIDGSTVLNITTTP